MNKSQAAKLTAVQVVKLINPGKASWRDTQWVEVVEAGVDSITVPKQTGYGTVDVNCVKVRGRDGKSIMHDAESYNLEPRSVTHPDRPGYGLDHAPWRSGVCYVPVRYLSAAHVLDDWAAVDALEAEAEKAATQASFERIARHDQRDAARDALAAETGGSVYSSTVRPDFIVEQVEITPALLDVLGQMKGIKVRIDLPRLAVINHYGIPLADVDEMMAEAEADE